VLGLELALSCKMGLPGLKGTTTGRGPEDRLKVSKITSKPENVRKQ